MRKRSQKLTKGQLLSDIRRVARELNHSPSSVEYRRFGSYNIRTLQRKFNASWKVIIASAGLLYTPRTSGRIPSTVELRNDILRVAHDLGHAPSRAQYQNLGKFNAETVRRRSGKTKWEDALASLAGVDREEVRSSQQRGGCYRTTEEWLSRLRELSVRLGHAPTTREANQSGINAHQLCLRVGGNWIDVLSAAQVDIRNLGWQRRLLSTPTEIMIKDVIAVSCRLGHTAKIREYIAHGHYPYTVIRGRLGGWKKVKAAVNDVLPCLNGQHLKNWTKTAG